VLAEPLDVLRHVRGCLYELLPLHQHPDLFDDLGVGQRGDVTHRHFVRYRCQHTAHDLPRPCLRHVGNNAHALRPCDLSDQPLELVHYRLLNFFAGHDARLERDVDFRHAPSRLVRYRNDCCLGDLRDDQARRLELLRPQAVPGDVDHIVDASEDSEISVRRAEGAVAGEVRPVTPVFALGILVVFRVVRLDEAIRILPDGLHDARPRIADADVAGLCATRHLFAFFVIDDRMNPRHARTGAARLHRIERRLGAAEKAAILGLPPGVHDHRFLLADYVVIPAPNLGLDRLTYGDHQFELMFVLERLF